MAFDLPLFLAFASFAFVASITPGPNNLMVMASGTAFGWRRTLPHVIGIALGFAVLIGTVGLGLGSLFERFPALLMALKIVGTIWLLWLAWKLAAPALRPRAAAAAETASKDAARPLTLIEAATFQWVNPKSWTMAIAATGAYAGIASTPMLSTAVMALTFCIIAPICNGTWLGAGQLVQGLMAGERSGRIALLVMAGLVVASAIIIAVG